ncbi:hypothetical protein AMATHDRAFT_64617 [Amanita thiersii Skay4041]|uniref:Uncharacterized protein n=1 Tax=Amanita thiersii Skay4041 TaxID=703135 RepID=A0A2A9NFE1_9AGAR|nr:hypothetical protein AMATHDRAFT_64617 [Amanita thiersii Skay4041]
MNPLPSPSVNFFLAPSCPQLALAPIPKPYLLPPLVPSCSEDQGAEIELGLRDVNTQLKPMRQILAICSIPDCVISLPLVQ